MPELTSYTCPLPADKVAALRRDLAERGYEFRDVPYAHFGAASDGEKVSLAVYTSGKLVIQGRGTKDFIEFYLEPVLLGVARLGYEHVHDPSMLDARIGVDESGKGDFFGPLVAAGVYVDKDTARPLLEAGVKDSKLIKSDARIEALAEIIRRLTKFDVVPIGPPAYNRLQARMGNVNSVLGWAHARVIENMLGKVDCGKAISDQFGNERIVRQALMEKGRQVKLIQRHKAESDLAVAAASILARDEFVRRLHAFGREYGVVLPKGASRAVEQAAIELVRQRGPGVLAQVAKTHFKTSQRVLAAAGATA